MLSPLTINALFFALILMTRIALADIRKMCWLSLPFVGIGEFRTVSNVHAPVTGRHVWIFFEEPVAAGKARKLGNAILTEAMKRNLDILPSIHTTVSSPIRTECLKADSEI